MRGHRFNNFFRNTTSIPAWVLVAAGIAATVDVDFTTGRVFGGTLSNLCQCSRASSGYAQNADGSWVSFANNVARITTKGLLVEEGRTNSIRNNTMAGAVVMADGVEKVTNGNFASNANWIISQAGGSTVTFGVNQVTFVNDGINNASIDQQITGLTVGRNYVVSGASTTASSVSILVGTSQGDGSLLNNIFNSQTNQLHKFGFTATQSSLWLRLGRLSSGGPATITFISVQDGERIENGNFALNPINAAQNTVQNGWQWGTGGATTVTWNGVDTVTINADGANTGTIDASFPSLPGCTYTLLVDLGANTSVQVGTARGNASLLNVTATGAGTKLQFTGTGTTTWVRFARNASGATTIKNVSVQSAGALPTNWNWQNLNFGLLGSVAAVGSESGFNSIDIQIAGTTTTTFNNSPLLASETVNQVSGTYGSTWAYSQFAYVAAGNLTNVTALKAGVAFSGSGAGSSYATFANASGVLGNNRITQVSTPLISSTSAINPQAIVLSASNGVAINFTLRIGMPQLENCVINSTVASAAINAGGSGGTDGAAVFQVSGGTGTAAQLNVTVSGGVITAINSVASAGNYTTFPPSPATLTRVSGAGVGLTGASVNLTPTNNAALGFPTSPIATSSGAAARSGETISIAGITLSQIGAILLRYAGTPTNTNNTKGRQYGWNYTDSGNARLSMRAADNVLTQSPNTAVGDGISNSGIFDLTNQAAETNTGWMTAWNASNTRVSQNGRAIVSNTKVWAPSAQTLYLGCTAGASGQINDYVKRFAYWSRDVSDAGMQQVSVTQ